jgi:cell division septation protein DedD
VPKNEDGEFELILGNRQLMSVFFIVVILLGVFFAMGYIVGRNASPVGAPDVASRQPETKPVDTDTSSSTKRETTPATTKETTHDTTQPADARKETDSQPKETASQQGPATKPTPPPEPAPAPVKTPSRAAASSEPQAGRTYLQISAIDHDKAEILVELLRKKNFSAIAAEIPEKPGVFRVLVGPISEADINKTRAALQDASFPGKEAVKRTF